MYVVETKPGFMKHSFTGFKPVFANLHMHLVFLEQFKPLRTELMRRTEGASESGWVEALRTTVLTGIDAIAAAIRQYTATDALDPDLGIDERNKMRKAFIESAISKDKDFEELSRQVSATHTDQILHPSQIHPYSVTFDYQGLTDKDWVQPTPDRLQHPQIRSLVIGLDGLMVTMSNSHSSDLARAFLSDESAIWISDLVDLRNIIDSARHVEMPFLPSSVSLNERDTRFNADGSADPPISQGDSPGEVTGTNRTGPRS